MRTHKQTGHKDSGEGTGREDCSPKQQQKHMEIRGRVKSGKYLLKTPVPARKRGRIPSSIHYYCKNY